MPSLGADMEAAVLIEWRVKVGDTVKRGDIIAEVTTDKGDIEIEVFESGVVEKLIAKPGSKLPVDSVLAVIGTGEKAAPPPAPKVARSEPARAAPQEDATGAPKTPEKKMVEPAEQPPAAPPPQPRVAPAKTKYFHASPLARKVAAQLGVNLSAITGTGPGGAIESSDVERAASKGGGKAVPDSRSAPAKTPVSPAKPGLSDANSGMRRAIASAMARSNREIPHYYLQTRIDMSAALEWLKTANAARPIKQRLLPAVLLLKAVARALQKTPDLNAYWENDQLARRDAVHIGFAIASRVGGLITPAIHDVQEKSLDEIMAALNDLIPRARAGKLRSSELSDGTITVTNLGDLGVETVFGVIYPPQVALVGFGRIAEQAWARDGMLGVHPVMTATLAADHRATDGRTGGEFLDALNQLLQDPEAL